MHLLVQAIIVGILIGGVYALLAGGQAMIFGVTRTVNFAQAIFAVMCSYLSYTLFQDFGLDPFLSVLVLVPAMFVFGGAIHIVLLRRLSRSGAELSLLVLFALGIGIQGVLDFFYKTDTRVIATSYANDSWTVLGYQVPAVRFFAFLLAVAVLGALHLIRQYTKFGRALRATTQNPDAARLLGVDVERVSAIAMGLGVAAAGAAGAVFGMVIPFSGNSQLDLLNKLLAIGVLGGMASFPGTIVAAVILGVIESVVAVNISPDWSSFSFLVVLFAVLTFRPQGLFGQRLRGAA
ncbi:branched-chain amino acid ABC transporter permease [Streptomyces sp. NPDC060223]|uniref:branched-chain amino acid ABC transporter permease n=1 Tax=unclassified Streptomyces TaxID=2593676 RepID=UPI003629E3C8